MAVGRPNPVGNITGANDKVADNIITHAVNLERLKSSEYQKVFQLLDKLETADIKTLYSPKIDG